MTTPTNTAAWINSSRARLTVSSAPYPTPQPTQVVIKVSALALNPLDCKLQDYDPIPTFPITYPAIFGSDVAGIVVAVGDDVKAFSVGQHVMAHAVGHSVHKPSAGGFQQYTCLNQILVIALPTSVAFEDAAALPLATHSAATALFHSKLLSLPVDELRFDHSGSEKRTLLVWGGASGVGGMAVQLAAKGLGLRVVTTASPKNHNLSTKELGAVAAVDYHATDAVEQIVAALKNAGEECVGAIDAVGSVDTIESCARVLAALDGTVNKRVVSVLAPPPETKLPEGVTAARIEIAGIFATDIPWKTHAWVSKALEEGLLVLRPRARVVGTGLEAVQGGLDELKKGVSAEKLVVKL